MPYCEYCGLSQQESDNLPCEYSRTNKHSFKSILRSSGKESGEKQIDLGNFKKQSVLIEKQSQAQQLDSMKLASEMLQKQETEITKEKEKEKEKTKQEEPWINIQVQYNPNVDSFGLRFNCLVCEFLLEFNALVTAHF